MATTSWKTCGTGATVARSGGDDNWANPSNITADDTSYARTDPGKSSYSDWLVASNFGFTTGDIPTGSTIDGIEVRVTWRGESTDVDQDAIHIDTNTTGDPPPGDNKSTGANVGTSMGTATWGGAADTWNVDPSDAQVRASGMSAWISIANDNGSFSRWCDVDFVEMRVTYTIPSYDITPPQGNLTLSSEAPTAVIPLGPIPFYDLVLEGQAPTPSTLQAFVLWADMLVPYVEEAGGANHERTPPQGDIAFSTFAPTLDLGISPASDDLQLTATAPSVDENHFKTPGAGVITFYGKRYPQVTDNIGQGWGAAVTSHLVNMPTTVNAGDHIVVFFGAGDQAGSAITVTTPVGWVKVEDFGGGFAGDFYSRTIFVKTADGTEGGTTVDFVTNNAVVAASKTLRIEKAYGTPVSALVGGFVTGGSDHSGSTSAPNPPSLSTNWGAEGPTLWLPNSVWVPDGATPTSDISNYTSLAYVVAGIGGDNVGIVVFSRELTAVSENPGSFTLSETEAATTSTLAIRGTDYHASLDTGITVPAGDLALDSQAPEAIEDQQDIIPSVDLTFSAEAPGLSWGVVVPADDLTLTGAAPSLNTGVFPGVGDLALDSQAPVLDYGIEIPAGDLAFSSDAPEAIEDQTDVVPAAQLQLTSQAPEVRPSIEVPAADLALSTVAPLVATSIEVPAADLTLSLSIPFLVDQVYINQDITVNEWTDESGGNTNIYQSVDEPLVPNDSDYIQSDMGTPWTLYEGKLEGVGDPLRHDGHKITIRMRSPQPGAVNLTTSIRQGASTEIASWADGPVGASEVTYTHELSEAEAANITDYTDLRVRLVVSAV